MIIKTNLVPQPYWAMTIWPFIFVRPEHADDKPIIVHEMVHFNEQSILVPIWWARYIFSTKFRVAAEVRAYKAQIAAGGLTVAEAAGWLTTYDKKLTIAAATALLE
jgi:hypothetical protein